MFQHHFYFVALMIATKRCVRVCCLSAEVLDTAGCRVQQYSVVALGSGQSSVNKWLCYGGTMVQDCSAITIARRALKR